MFKMPLDFSAAIVLLLICPLSSLADTKTAKTPLKLADLLPVEANIDPSIEFDLLRSKDGAQDGYSSLWRWKVELVQERPVVHYYSASLEDDTTYDYTGLIYNREHNLHSIHSSMSYGTFIKSDEKCTVENDQIQFKATIQTKNDDGSWASTEAEESYPVTQNGIPAPWLPLAFAYHIRNQHSKFQVFTQAYDAPIPNETYFEILDRRKLPVLGKKQDVFVIRGIQKIREADVPHEMNFRGEVYEYHCLANGEIIYIKFIIGDEVKYTATSVSTKDLKEHVNDEVFDRFTEKRRNVMSTLPED